MIVDSVSISLGNEKMGKVMSVSLPPITSCGKGLPCYKTCYAAKLARLRPNVRDAWAGNWDALMRNRDVFFDAVYMAIMDVKPELFRWHVAGDMADYDYLLRMRAMAVRCPMRRFMAFTKKFDLLRLYAKSWGTSAPSGTTRPGNLTLIASAWPGLVVPPDVRSKFPVSWMRSEKQPDRRIPADGYVCQGDCETCKKCWGMAPGECVVFDAH